MTVYLLDDSLQFPDPLNSDPSGLLAIGGDLSVERLLMAYRRGIFPWYSEGDPIMWFSPDPRLVIFLDKLYVSKKLRKVINSGVFEVKFDSSFEAVIKRCAIVDRRGQKGTWITEKMIEAYIHLHKKGYAHSVETYSEGELVGGLYGVSLGGVFFGESMFHEVSNASKVALYYLVEKLSSWGFDFIDSQVPNEHMKSMGGKEIDRIVFLDMLTNSLRKKTKVGRWNL